MSAPTSPRAHAAGMASSSFSASSVASTQHPTVFKSKDVHHADPKHALRGLTEFLVQIRKSRTREEESMRVRQELANIRSKYENAHKSVNSNEKRMITYKLIFIHLLGHDVDTGHAQALELVAGKSYKEKSCGYFALELIRHANLMMLVVNSMKKDLNSFEDEHAQCLALTAVANAPGRELAAALGEDVKALATSPRELKSSVRKKSLIALLRLSKEYPDLVTLPTEREMSRRLDAPLETNVHPGKSSRMGGAPLTKYPKLGVRLAQCHLLHHIVATREDLRARVGEQTLEEHFASEGDPLTAADHARQDRERGEVQLVVVRALSHLLISSPRSHSLPMDYEYHSTMAPWNQVALLRVLAAMKSPPGDDETMQLLCVTIEVMLTRVKWAKDGSVNNASRAPAFEAMRLLVSYEDPEGRVPLALKQSVLTMLDRMAISAHPDTRYLALSCMGFISSSSARDESKWWLKALKARKSTVLRALSDPEASVRRRALYLVVELCDDQEVAPVTDELLRFLTSGVDHDFDERFTEELVLRIAALAERYASKSAQRYIDVCLRLLRVGGDHVGDLIWHRVARLLTNLNDPVVQRRAALEMYKILLASSESFTETIVRVAAYVLGEFGYLLCTEDYSALTSKDLDHDVLGIDLFGSIHQYYSSVEYSTKAICVTSYVKLVNLFPDLTDAVREVFESGRSSRNAELQQRCCEALALLSLSEDRLGQVLEPMPMWRSSAATEVSSREVPSPSRSQDPKKTEVQASSSNAVRANASEPSVVSASSSTPRNSLQHQPNRSEEVAVNKLFLNASLMGSDRTLLYRDDGLEIGSEQSFHGDQRNEGRVTMRIRNLSSAPFTRLRVTQLRECLVPEDALRFQAAVRLEDLPTSLSAGEQLSIAFDFQCLRVYSGAPRLAVERDGEALISLRVPVTLNRFCHPVDDMTGPDFMRKFKLLETQIGGVVKSQRFASNHTDATWESGVQNIVKLMSLLGLRLITTSWPIVGITGGALLEGTRDLAGAGVVHTSELHPVTGRPTTFGVLVRVELHRDSRVARVSVQAAHATLANAFHSIVLTHVVRLLTL